VIKVAAEKLGVLLLTCLSENGIIRTCINVLFRFFAWHLALVHSCLLCWLVSPLLLQLFQLLPFLFWRIGALVGVACFGVEFLVKLFAVFFKVRVTRAFRFRCGSRKVGVPIFHGLNFLHFIVVEIFAMFRKFSLFLRVVFWRLCRLVVMHVGFKSLSLFQFVVIKFLAMLRKLGIVFRIMCRWVRRRIKVGVMVLFGVVDLFHFIMIEVLAVLGKLGIMLGIMGCWASRRIKVGVMMILLGILDLFHFPLIEFLAVLGKLGIVPGIVYFGWFGRVIKMRMWMAQVL